PEKIAIPEKISLLPLRNSVLFPGSIIPIDVGRKKSLALIEAALDGDPPVIGLVTQRDKEVEDPGPGDLYAVGCASRIFKVIKLRKDNLSVILQGLARIRVLRVDQQEPFMIGQIQVVRDPVVMGDVLQASMRDLKELARRVIALMPDLPKEANALVDSID